MTENTPINTIVNITKNVSLQRHSGVEKLTDI